MKKIKIRRDRLDGLKLYSCDECERTPNEDDTIIKTEINYEYLTFCSEECILKYLKGLGDVNNVFERKQIEVYEPTPKNELVSRIQNMKPNTRLNLDGNVSVDYFKIDGLMEHYIVNRSIGSRLVRLPFEAVDYIMK